MANKTPVGLLLDNKLKARLDAYCKQTGAPRTVVMRRAIKRYLKAKSNNGGDNT